MRVAIATGWRVFSIFAAFAVGLNLAGGQEDKMARPLTEAEIKDVVLKATDICRTTPLPYDMDPRAQKENGKYLETIKPLLDRGKDVLPSLRKVASSPEVPLLERRLAQVIAARIEHPEQFKTVAPYYEPAQWEMLEGWDNRMLQPRWRFREPGSEIVHPEVRKEYEQIREKIGQAKAKYLDRYKQIKPRVDKEDPKAVDELTEMMERRTNELNKLFDQLEKKTHDRKCRRLRIDPSYLLAWEEGVLRPVYRTMKREFADFVTQIGDAESAPVLAELLRRSILVDRPVPNSTFSIHPADVQKSLDALPAPAELLALADVLRHSTRAEQREKLREIFGAMGAAREKELARLETDPQLKKALEPLREVVDWFRQNNGKPPSP